MNLETFLEQLRRINTWRRGGVRAPHKPLLILFALGQWQSGHRGPLKFGEIEKDLLALLEEFAPYRQRQRPEYPFWRLANEGIWVLDGDLESMPNTKGSDPPIRWLRRLGGQFSQDVRRLLERDHTAVCNAADFLLREHFPASLHGDICDFVGLDDSSTRGAKSKRDHRFRDRILTAYEYRCAICGWDLALGRNPVGLEAAHIKWHQAGGPSTEDNGLALCVLHHKLFDLGAYTVEPEQLRVIVTDLVNGQPQIKSQALLTFHRRPIALPQRQVHRPNKIFLSWHSQQVFKGEPRE